MRVIYLHGFASGPGSGKAQFFKRKFSERGVELEIPDLAGGDFEHLTISGQVATIDREVRGEPVSLMGSSMGGYLAALYASTHPEVQRLVLLAPAFYFPQRWVNQLGPEKAAEWERTGFMDVYHYAECRTRRISYNLVRDAALYPPEPSFSQSALIFHGTEDDVVPVTYSHEFAASNLNVRLRVLASDHQLTDAVNEIWREAGPFC